MVAIATVDFDVNSALDAIGTTDGRWYRSMHGWSSAPYCSKFATTSTCFGLSTVYLVFAVAWGGLHDVREIGVQSLGLCSYDALVQKYVGAFECNRSVCSLKK